MVKRLWIGLGAIGICLIISPMSGYAQGVDAGEQEYLASCASCHGTAGKGNGPAAEYFKPKVYDLTMLAKNNAGVFPFARVYDVIDGRQVVAVHGPRDMPVWGNEYREDSRRIWGNATREELSSYVRGRIIGLIGYIYTLQAK